MSLTQAFMQLLASLVGAGEGTSAASIAVALLTLVLCGIWLTTAPSRLPVRAVGLGSALIAVGMAAASVALAAADAFLWPVGPALLALLFGHLGLSVGMARQAARAAVGPATSAVAKSTFLPVATPAADAPVSTRLLEHTTLGRYRIDRQLGRGAMGAVYLGQDPKIGRPVAIKTMALAQEFDGADLQEARARFFREAETAGRLQHPDIVTIYDAGEDQNLAYIAMEYLKGRDLQPFARPGALLPVPQVLRIVARVADALAYAHSQGVVHRDIKPANVMVEFDSTQVVAVKVTDFGIARITDASRTRTGMVLGSPSFMSPEQMAGQRVDGRSDLYSLGVMLYQLLIGQLPHRAESMAKLMGQIAHERPADIRTARPELPESLALIVARALEKRPEARHADGRQFAAALLAVEPQSAPSEPRDAPAASTSPASSLDAFAATVQWSRDDPRHNPTL